MSYKPFPVGTVRGPYTCGKGNDYRGGVQFAVKKKDGSWAYFIEARKDEAKCQADAEAYAAKEKEKQNAASPAPQAR